MQAACLHILSFCSLNHDEGLIHWWVRSRTPWRSAKRRIAIGVVWIHFDWSSPCWDSRYPWLLVKTRLEPWHKQFNTTLRRHAKRTRCAEFWRFLMVTYSKLGIAGAILLTSRTKTIKQWLSASGPQQSSAAVTYSILRRNLETIISKDASPKVVWRNAYRY